MRNDYKEAVLVERLGKALKKINPSASSEAIEQAIKHLLRTENQKLLVDNENFHKMLADGIDVPVRKGQE